MRVLVLRQFKRHAVSFIPIAAHFVLISAVKIVALHSQWRKNRLMPDMAEWLRSRLQSGIARFDSGCRLFTHREVGDDFR